MGNDVDFTADQVSMGGCWHTISNLLADEGEVVAPCVKIDPLTISWTYSFSGQGGTYHSAGYSSASKAEPTKLYVVFDTPETPMQSPWVEVLDYACKWAGTQTDEPGAVKAITEAVYWKFGKDYWGGTTHCEGTTFTLSGLLDDSQADCRDFSATVQVFANAIGGSQTQVRGIVGPFFTKSINPSGWEEWIGLLFDYHQVGHYSNVFDASLRVCGANPRVPCDEEIDGSYKSDLYDSLYWTPQDPFEYEEVN